MLGWIESSAEEEKIENNALQEAEGLQGASRQKVLLYIVGRNVEQACVAALEIIDSNLKSRANPFHRGVCLS